MEDYGKTAVVAIHGATFNIAPWSFLFADKNVNIATDYDEAGRRVAAKIENALSDVAQSISYLDLEVSKEVAGE